MIDQTYTKTVNGVEMTFYPPRHQLLNMSYPELQDFEEIMEKSVKRQIRNLKAAIKAQTASGKAFDSMIEHLLETQSKLTIVQYVVDYED